VVEGILLVTLAFRLRSWGHGLSGPTLARGTPA
jgi:hypothetical protein